MTDAVRALLEAYDVVMRPDATPVERRAAAGVFKANLDGLTPREADAYYKGVRARRDAAIAAEPPSWTYDEFEETA